MKRKFTIGTAFFGIGAALSTYVSVGMLVQDGWHGYHVGLFIVAAMMWWLVWLSTNPEE